MHDIHVNFFFLSNVIRETYEFVSAEPALLHFEPRLRVVVRQAEKLAAGITDVPPLLGYDLNRRVPTEELARRILDLMGRPPRPDELPISRIDDPAFVEAYIRLQTNLGAALIGAILNDYGYLVATREG